LGFNKNQISQFERLSKNPEAVEEAKQEARAEGKIVT